MVRCRRVRPAEPSCWRSCSRSARCSITASRAHLGRVGPNSARSNTSSYAERHYGSTPLKFGLTLSNRGIALGLNTPADLLDMAGEAEESGLFDSVFAGDSLFAQPRLDSVTLLAAIAGRTNRVKLGPACMGSFPLRNPLLLAYEWASLDQLSNGRTIMVACSGGRSGGLTGEYG